MRIGIDARLWNQTGVGRYIRNLIFHLLEIDKDHEYVLFIRSEDVSLVENQISNLKFKISNLKLVTVDIPWHSLSEQFKFPKIISKEKIDLMHFTYFSMPIIYSGKYILTIHDLILHHFSTGRASTKPFPVFYAKQFFYRKVIEKSAKKALSIIAVSDTTKSEIIDHLKIEPKKIKVIYEGADIKTGEKAKDLDFPYLLYVGNAYPHKNLEVLVEAMKEPIKRKEQLKLIMVCKNDYFYKRLISGLDQKTRDSIILKENISDKELSDLYFNAKALVLPSLMEGFGLPILEAFASKCIVVASDIPVFREIGKDALIYFDPQNVLDVRGKIEYALSLENSKKSELNILGKEILESFSWSKMAKETLKIYESR